MMLSAIRIAACCVPYAFLCLYGDAEYGALWPAALCALCAYALMRRSKPRFLLLLSGHALSLLSSCICLALFQTERFSWYFKPFSAMQMILLYTLAAFAFHLFLLRRRP